jgi:hypothetical protein
MAPPLVLKQQFTLYVCCFKNVGMQGTSLHIAVKHPQTWKIKLWYISSKNIHHQLQADQNIKSFSYAWICPLYDRPKY